MTKTIARHCLGLPGLFISFTGLVFITNPTGAAAKLQLGATTAEGLSNLRGLAGAPLLAVGATLLLAAATARLEYARPAAIFLATLFAARLASHVLDGADQPIGLFLAVPAVTFGLMLAGHKLLDRAEATAPR